MPIAALSVAIACALVPGHAPSVVSRCPACRMDAGQAFKTPKSTDTAAEEQAARAKASGMTPMEYEEATRRAANEYLMTKGAHAADDSATSPRTQTADFLKQLWDVDSIPAVPDAAAADSSRVLATIYEIGGPLTGILSTSVAKKLPLIPHVGIRVHGVEYFYSDHIEYRTVPVMEEMLGERPQVSLDLGECTLSPEEVQAWWTGSTWTGRRTTTTSSTRIRDLPTPSARRSRRRACRGRSSRASLTCRSGCSTRCPTGAWGGA